MGEAILGKKVGHRAVLWGAIGGTIPDLDVLLNPFLTDVQGTLAHRTFSHSLIALTLLVPVLGYAVHRLYRNKTPATARDWSWLFFGALITHPLLDAFTNYGTMLFYPLSEVRIAWRTIYIIDPLYTLPLLIGTIVVLFSARQSARRRAINRWALAISSAYLLTTCAVKLYVNQTVQTNIVSQQLDAQKFMSSPAFFNVLLWSVIVDTGREYRVGYYSLLDADGTINFQTIPQQRALLKPYLTEASPIAEELRDLLQFTEGFYAANEVSEGIVLNDLRFGLLTGWFDSGNDYIFSFQIHQETEETYIEQREQSFSLESNDFRRFWERTLGEKQQYKQ